MRPVPRKRRNGEGIRPHPGPAPAAGPAVRGRRDVPEPHGAGRAVRPGGDQLAGDRRPESTDRPLRNDAASGPRAARRRPLCGGRNARADGGRRSRRGRHRRRWGRRQRRVLQQRQREHHDERERRRRSGRDLLVDRDLQLVVLIDLGRPGEFQLHRPHRHRILLHGFGGQRRLQLQHHGEQLLDLGCQRPVELLERQLLEQLHHRHHQRRPGLDDVPVRRQLAGRGLRRHARLDTPTAAPRGATAPRPPAACPM